MRRYRALVPLLILVGCDRQLHRLFEAPPPPYIRLSITLGAPAVTLARGEEQTIAVTVTRTGEDRGPVSLAFEGAPAGVTASTKSSTTVGDVTTAAVSVRAMPEAAVGNYSVTVRAQANQATDATSLLVLTVIDPPDFVLGTTKPALTIARGGIARVGVALSRTNVASAVAFSASSDPGIAAQFSANPLSTDTTTATITVDAGVAAGTHTLVLHASAAGVADHTAALTIEVTADPLQVLVAGDVSSPQLSTVTEEVIVNRSVPADLVALSVDGLPPNVSATFDPLDGNNPTTTVHFQIAGTSPAGDFQLAVRARASGVPDAAAPVTLRIVPASIALSVAPASLTVFTGSGSTTSLAISRSNFTGDVAVTADPLPPGLSISFDSSSVRGNVAKATIAVGSAAAPGTYNVALHAAPIGLPTSAAQTAGLAVTVLAASGPGVNVALDWSRCAAPDWVAIQDGTGPWMRLTATQGIFVGGVSSSAGAIAYVEHGSSVTVRYLTSAELTTRVLDMCGPPSGSRTVTGSANFGSANELGVYSLGGGSGTSSAAQPNFTIAGARDGVHDLIAYSYFQNGASSRMLIRRDVAVGASTDSVAPVDFQGGESFAPLPMTPGVTLSGPFLAGETYSHSLSYLTTAACTGGPIYLSPGASLLSNGSFNFSLSTVGVPDALRRPDDFYLVTVFFSGNASFRSSSIAFHAPGVHPLQLAPLVPATTVSAVAGAYERLEAVFGTLSSAYNGTITLSYDDGSRSMTVSASRAYLDATTPTIVMPDLSAANGWPSSAAIPTGAHGGWRFTLDGNTSESSACTENRVTYSSGRTGVY
jgi:hypothetical protein